MFPVFGGLESHGDVAFGAVSRKRAALRYADLRRTQGGGGGGGGGAYIYVPPQRVWFWGHSTTGAGACEREKKNRLIAG